MGGTKCLKSLKNVLKKNKLTRFTRGHSVQKKNLMKHLTTLMKQKPVLNQKGINGQLCKHNM